MPIRFLTTRSRSHIINAVYAMLERDEDKAKFENHKGFSAFDTRWFHNEFEPGKYWHDSALIRAAYKLIKRYKKQLSEEGITIEDLTPVGLERQYVSERKH